MKKYISLFAQEDDVSQLGFVQHEGDRYSSVRDNYTGELLGEYTEKDGWLIGEINWRLNE